MTLPTESTPPTPPADPTPPTPPAEPPANPAEPQANPAEPPANTAPPTGPKGDPNDDAKAARLEQEAKDAKARADALQKQLDEAKTADDVKKAADEAKAQAEADAKAAEDAYKAQITRLGIEKALGGAGCIDTVSAMAHIDASKVTVAENGDVAGLDVEAEKKARPHLFGTPTPPIIVSTGAAHSGGTVSETAGSIADGVAAAFKKE